jgi:hypothetical protein
MPNQNQVMQSTDQIVQRLEQLKSRLGDKKAELAGEIDAISQSVRQLDQGSGYSQSQDNPRTSR